MERSNHPARTSVLRTFLAVFVGWCGSWVLAHGEVTIKGGAERCSHELRDTDAAMLRTVLQASPQREGVQCAVQALDREDSESLSLAREILLRDYSLAGVELGRALQLDGDVTLTSRGRERAQRILDDIVARLLSSLHSGKWEERIGAMRVLGDFRDKRALTSLATEGSDPDPNVALAAVQALNKFHDPAALPGLNRAMRHQGNIVAGEAVVGVASIGGEEAITALITLTKDEKVPIGIRQLASLKLRGLKDPRGMAAARELEGSLRPKWKRSLPFPPIIYLVAFAAASAAGAERQKAWMILLFAVASGSMILLVNPGLWIEGHERDLPYFWGLAVGYPVSTWVGGHVVGETIARLRNRDLGERFMGLMNRCLPVMLGAMVLWMVVAIALAAFAPRV